MATHLNGRHRGVSFWMSTVDDELSPRAGLPGDRDADVAIVGAGYTGLWTAYYLAQADPSLRIVVLEKEISGYGASGRNGGWCSALFPQSVTALARRHGRQRAVALHRALRSTVEEVGRVARAESIACSYAKGGTVSLVRSPAQWERARADVAEAVLSGLGDVELLGPAEASAHCGASDVLGGVYTPHCAAIHPAALVRGLAHAVERLGVTVYERTPVVGLEPRTVVTPAGRVRADVVVRATEGYTAGLPGHRRTLAPIYSLMVATPPLPPSFWESTGLAARETFTDYRHLIIYGQRTADDRLAFGGRGAPYHYGSGVRAAYDRVPRVFAALRATLGELFPALGRSAETEYAWGGPLGVAQDWAASVGYRREDGFAWAGGYVGDGVATANLAGRTLADLITGADSDLTTLPWVGHRSPRWAPEPLRWLGVNAGLRAMSAADHNEARTGQPSRLAARVNRLTGH